MSFARQSYPLRGLFWGIATILLVVCGRTASARAPAFTECIPARPPGFSVLLRPHPLVPSDNWEAGGVITPHHAALSREGGTFSPLSGLVRVAHPAHFHLPLAFPPANHRILHLLEIRGWLPFSHAPPPPPFRIRHIPSENS